MLSPKSLAGPADAIRSSEAAWVHHPVGRRDGCVAARGARAAARPDAAHRISLERVRRGWSRRPGPKQCFRAGLAGTRLEHRP